MHPAADETYTQVGDRGSVIAHDLASMSLAHRVPRACMMRTLDVSQLAVVTGGTRAGRVGEILGILVLGAEVGRAGAHAYEAGRAEYQKSQSYQSAVKAGATGFGSHLVPALAVHALFKSPIAAIVVGLAKPNSQH